MHCNLKREFITSRLKGKRGKTDIDEGKVVQKIEKIQGKNLVWVDLENPDREHLEKLLKEYELNDLNIEDCLTKFELPKLDSYDDHFFVILHFPPLAQKSGISKNSQLSMFVGKDFLITVHQGDLKPLTDLVKISKSNGLDKYESNDFLNSHTSVLMHTIIDELVDDLMHVSRKIIANLDELEDIVFDDKISAARNIALLRREINRLRRIANPLKKVVQEIVKGVQRFSDDKDENIIFMYNDVIDHIDKVIETLEESKETMEIYKDTDYVLSTEKTNKVLSILTIIFTLAIPATVVGTFYGMNIMLPGGINDSAVSSELDAFTPFIILILASAIPAALMFIYFKKNGWTTN